MAKRIVKEILKNGNVQYKVETNRNFFGFKINWRVCTYSSSSIYGDFSCDAIFSTLEEAQRFIGINPNPTMHKEVIHGVENVQTTIWYDPQNILPINNKTILVEFNDNKYSVIEYDNMFSNTKMWKRWAYMSDVINILK